MTPDMTSGADRPPSQHPAVRALFQQRVDGDDSLLRLAGLRFAQAGLGAEIYATTPEQLTRQLGFVVARPCLPIVHLDRRVNLLHEQDRAMVEAFATRFAGRTWGLVVHDKAEMAARTDELAAAIQALGARLDQLTSRPYLLLEYAAGLELDWYAKLAERLKEAECASFCIDIGHVGIRQARSSFARRHPGLDLTTLTPHDPRLPELVADVQAAVASALPAALDLTRSLAGAAKPLHFHLHDGHPIIPGLSDHYSFLTQVPIPFDYAGRRTLDPLYGPTGLTAIIDTAIQTLGAQRTSFTLEIHQAEGRLPLDDAAELFRHWTDTTNAERMNYWLSVLAQNHVLIRSILRSTPPPRPLGV
jgi:hypothetical protein